MYHSSFKWLRQFVDDGSWWRCQSISNFPHHVGISSVFEQHIFHLLNWLDLLPLAIFYELFVNLVVSFEEIIEPLITVSNIPSNDSSLLDYSDQLSESLGHDGAREHAGTTEQHVVRVVGNWSWCVRGDVAAESFLVETFLHRGVQQALA